MCDERLEAYADLITLRPFRGEKDMWIYRESDQLIVPMVEVAWMPHAVRTDVPFSSAVS